MLHAAQFPWFEQLEQDQQDLIKLSEYLYEREGMSQVQLSDYGFVVFPIAKAYEGFLKQYLFDLSLISQHTFESNRFRIGRAMNPDIRENQQDEFWLYDDLEQMCGATVAKDLWNTWLLCRNRVVHFFPLETHRIPLKTAGEKIEMVLNTIDMAYQCKVELKLEPASVV
jgi:hypothetical protein